MKPLLRVLPFTLAFLIALVSQATTAQSTPEFTPEVHTPLSSDEVVNNLIQRNSERARALGAYEGSRIYRLEYHGFPGSRNAEMVVDVKYRSPGTKQFTIRSQQGSKLILERVFKRMLQSEQEAGSEENQQHIALNKENYSFVLQGAESISTGAAYILAVAPLTENKLLYRGRIWVDAKDFAVVRIEAVPAKNPSFWTKETKIEQVYEKVGNFWLPLSNRSTSAIRLGGHASFSIEYKDYKIVEAAPLGPQSENAGSK